MEALYNLNESKRVFLLLLHDTAMQDCYLLLASCCLQKYQVLQNQVPKTGLKSKATRLFRCYSTSPDA